MCIAFNVKQGDCEGFHEVRIELLRVLLDRNGQAVKTVDTSPNTNTHRKSFINSGYAVPPHYTFSICT